MVRAYLEGTYDGICTIIESRKIKLENHSTAFEDVVILENQPCRISYQNQHSTTQTMSYNKVDGSVKLFISPDVEIKNGSKIIVTQNDKTVEYTNSGEPARYETHQEIILELFDGKA